METKKMDQKEALDLLRRAVEEKGEDYVYEPVNPTNEGYCYFDPATGEPSCIVGHVLSYAGLAVDDMEYTNAGLGFNTPNVQMVVAEAGLTFTDDALQVLANAQTAQDGSYPWGKVLNLAATNVLVEAL